MKSLIKIGALFLSVLSYTAASGIKSNPADILLFEQTHICEGCNLSAITGFRLKQPFNSFEGSILTGSDLTNASFFPDGTTGANLWYNSNFDNAVLIGTYWTVSLDGSSFKNANLQDAVITNMNIASHVDFTGANLKHADLQGSLFTYSNFSGAQLDGANLYSANLCHAIITEAQINSTVNHACAMRPDCEGRYPFSDGTPCGF